MNQLSETVRNLILVQSTREMEASSIYLAQSYVCGMLGWDGAAKHFSIASDEERQHMRKLLDYVAEYDDSLPPIPAATEQKPSLAGASLLTAVQAVLHLERTVTKRFQELAETAEREKDQVTEAFLQWFLLEQIASVTEYLGWERRLLLAGDDRAALLRIDHEMGKG